MSSESEAASLSREEIIALMKAHRELQEAYADVARQLEWFKRQLFGPKSERRLFDSAGRQLSLGEILLPPPSEAPPIEVPAHRRRRPETNGAEDGEERLRFDPSVPVEEIEVPNPEMEGENPDDYVMVGEKVTERLAQRPGSYVVLRYRRKVYKRKADGVFSCPSVPRAVLEKSCADVSLLAGILIDKFRFHLPLYRQHQRLEAAGIHLSRGSLTHWVHQSGELLEPVYDANLVSILSSKVLAMDETPIKAGRKQRDPPHRGVMKTAYFWPLYGDKDEIAFPFATTRGSVVVRETLKGYSGVLLTDGYKVYDQYAKVTGGIEHAQCWSHARRQYEKAETSDPKRVQEILEQIAGIYTAEAPLRAKEVSPEKTLAFRAECVRPLVEAFFEKLKEIQREEILLPSSPFTQAVGYSLQREKALRVFLENPDVPMDTNHLERAIRPIAMGRRAWLFCWTEVGAKYVGIIQSLIYTCRVQGIDPYVYLVDVLQRIDTHPAKDVALLMPRLWKDHFAGNPLLSDLDRNKRTGERPDADAVR
jgi:transposase